MEEARRFHRWPTAQRVLTSPSLFTNEYLLLKGDRDSDRSDKDTLDVTTNDRSFNSMGVQVTAKYEVSTGPSIIKWRPVSGITMTKLIEIIGKRVTYGQRFDGL